MRATTRIWKFLSPALLLLAGLSAGCSESSYPPGELPPPAEAAEATEADESAVRPASLGSTAPVSQTGQIYLTGQPTVEDIALMKSKGIKTIVSLRKEDEVDWNEEKIVAAAGMQFVRVPFSGAGELNAKVFEQVRALLRDSESQPLVLHCGAANRVGAVWLPYRVLDQGVPLDEAVREAREAGLTSEDLERKARAYVRRQQMSADEPAEEPESTAGDDAPGDEDVSAELDESASVDGDVSVAE